MMGDLSVGEVVFFVFMLVWFPIVAYFSMRRFFKVMGKTDRDPGPNDGAEV